MNPLQDSLRRKAVERLLKESEDRQAITLLMLKEATAWLKHRYTIGAEPLKDRLLVVIEDHLEACSK